MTDKPVDNPDKDFSLNHFDETADAEDEQHDASMQNESFFSDDLFADADQPDTLAEEEEKADPFDSTWGADRFAELGYGKKEPIIPQQPETKKQAVPPAQSSPNNAEQQAHASKQTSTSGLLKHPDPFDNGRQHTNENDVAQPVIAPTAQARPDDREEETVVTPPLAPAPEKQRTGIKPMTAFAIIAMVVAAIAIWLNPGTQTRHDTPDNEKTQQILEEDTRISSLESRLSTIEQQRNQQNTVVKQQLDQLQQQLSALTSLLAKQVRKQSALQHHNAAITGSASGKQTSRRSVTPPAHSATGTKKNTGWIVNLVSLDSQAAAKKALARYRAQGISATIFFTKVKGKTWYRLRIAGFANRQDASTQQKYLAKKYGIKDAWIQKP